MKKLILFVLFVTISVFTFSQDIISTNLGEKIKCKIIGEDSINVYFNLIKNDRELKTFINKSSIVNIQYEDNQNVNLFKENYNTDLINCITVGFLQGGGSLIGIDLEYKLSDRFGIQAGAGLVGFGGGINIHFKPYIRSSFISLQYWHQGVGNSFTQSLLGPSIVYRAKKLLSAQLGFGFTLKNGPAWPEDEEPIPAMLTYAIGLYFPW